MEDWLFEIKLEEEVKRISKLKVELMSLIGAHIQYYYNHTSTADTNENKIYHDAICDVSHTVFKCLFDPPPEIAEDERSKLPVHLHSSQLSEKWVKYFIDIYPKVTMDFTRILEYEGLDKLSSISDHESPWVISYASLCVLKELIADKNVKITGYEAAVFESICKRHDILYPVTIGNILVEINNEVYGKNRGHISIEDLCRSFEKLHAIQCIELDAEKNKVLKINQRITINIY